MAAIYHKVMSAYAYANYNDSDAVEKSDLDEHIANLSSLIKKKLADLDKEHSDYKASVREEIRKIVLSKNREIVAARIECSTLREENKRLKNFELQAACIPFLKEQLMELSVLAEKTCPVCYEQLSEDFCRILTCGHIFCKGCVIEVEKNSKICPICRSAFV